ncbi:NlpC/P60 family protein [Chenggangzhangella methanolivorans]|uniref:NlpC/P60 domain-containing protein n=1 Tax=Chenggangzhangella methanolivorans TaxID=1437009 RepID=A0A9E6R7T8_9HYPH|nr:NlpC/P60 family protein [Chenggangzhangella methanolivorans]QZN99800.1 hypothetical protein K6K41_24575 [Chenggangzhangella methanolivorans]
MAGWVADYRGLPFEEDGFSREGLCCRGLVWLAYRELLGIAIEAHRGVVSALERAAADRLFRGEMDGGPFITVERERELDVAWFHEMRERSVTATHVGLVIRPGLMLHASREAGVVTPENYSRGRWAKLLIGFRRHVEDPRP